MENWELDFEWLRVQHIVKDAMRRETLPDLNTVLFLIGIQLAPVEFAHIIGEIGPEPSTKDPFDRLLLSTAAAFQLKLVTLDRKLADHPLAWQPFLR